jgi:hypothetical protein
LSLQDSIVSFVIKIAMAEIACLTRVHDKYYDLKDFEHPGGQLALACAYQRDATELFHSYHQFKDQKKILEILKKYEVSIENSGGLIAKKSLFNWEEGLASPFYRDIRQSLDPYFAKNGTKMNSERVCEVLFLFFVALSQYSFLLKGWLFSLLTFPIPFLSLWRILLMMPHTLLCQRDRG